MLFDSEKLRDSTYFMKNYVVRVPQSIFICYKVSASDEEAAMRAVLAGETGDVHQELAGVPPPQDTEDFAERTKGWTVTDL